MPKTKGKRPSARPSQPKPAPRRAAVPRIPLKTPRVSKPKKSPPVREAANYSHPEAESFDVLEFHDGTQNPKELKMEVKKTYDWTLQSNAGQSTFRVVDGQAELVAMTAPTDKIRGFGFSSTVRQKDNESDLTFTVE